MRPHPLGSAGLCAASTQAGLQVVGPAERSNRHSSREWCKLGILFHPEDFQGVGGLPLNGGITLLVLDSHTVQGKLLRIARNAVNWFSF